MPKDIIHDDTLIPGTDNSTPMAVSIGWQRDGGVQLGSINLQNGDGDKRHTSEYGWFVDLDREMINKIIRVLRRARDQAFGVDE